MAIFAPIATYINIKMDIAVNFMPKSVINRNQLHSLSRHLRKKSAFIIFEVSGATLRSVFFIGLLGLCEILIRLLLLLGSFYSLLDYWIARETRATALRRIC